MIRINDKLSKILGDYSRDPRRDNWLWLYLSSIRVAQYNYMVLDKRTMRDTIANTILSANLNPQALLDSARIHLIPKSLLTWITDSERQHEWIKSKLFNMNSHHYQIPHTLDGREHILAIIDTLDAEFKLGVTEKLKKDWLEQTRKDKQLDWIKEEDEREACTYIWAWMQKNQPFLIEGYSEPLDHQSALAFFDSVHMTELEKKLCITSARRAWRQMIRRSIQNEKKQQNFLLTKRAIERLDELSKKYELPRTQIIEILLMMEHEKELYIEERIRILRKLDS